LSVKDDVSEIKFQLLNPSSVIRKRQIIKTWSFLIDRYFDNDKKPKPAMIEKGM
jgi:hypothetical protein